MLRWVAVLMCLIVSTQAFAGAGERSADAALGVITGTVTNADGTPAKGVTVNVFNAIAIKKPGEKNNENKTVATATTDDSGNFICKDVPIGSYRLVAGTMRTGIGTAKVTVQAAATYTVAIKIRPPREPSLDWVLFVPAAN